MTTLLKQLTSDEIHAQLAHLGVSPRLARQIQVSALRRGEIPASLPGVSPRVIEEVRRHTSIPHLALVGKVVSQQDQFAKYLFQGDGPQPFEAVRIPLMHRPEDRKYIVCVSSQVGCALGCAFCATGRMGFRRNLSAWEIVDQVIKVQADSEFPVRGVVFMGMGEPLLNYDAVIQAARIICEPCGLAIDGKAITISTAGIAPAIRRYAAEGHKYRLIVSLTSADPATRASLMPVEKLYPCSELFEALWEYHRQSGRRITLGWTMIAGVNTTPRDAEQLAELVGSLPVTLDLIDVNDPSGRFQPPTRDELDQFRDALTQRLGMPVARRYSGGQDIAAACGMLTAQWAGNAPQ